MSDFWKNRETMRQRTRQIRENQPGGTGTPELPASPGSPAAEHKAAQEKLQGELDRRAKNHPNVGMGGE